MEKKNTGGFDIFPKMCSQFCMLTICTWNIKLQYFFVREKKKTDFFHEYKRPCLLWRNLSAALVEEWVKKKKKNHLPDCHMAPLWVDQFSNIFKNDVWAHSYSVTGKRKRNFMFYANFSFLSELTWFLWTFSRTGSCWNNSLLKLAWFSFLLFPLQSTLMPQVVLNLL